MPDQIISRVFVVLAIAVSVVACSSSNGGDPDAGRVDAAPQDARAQDGNMSDSAPDSATTDGPQSDLAQPDLGPLKCFGFSLDPNIPLAIDGTFTKTSPLWRRPHDEPPVCPATVLLPPTKATVPFVVYAFCNKDTKAHTFDFEMLSQAGPKGEPALDDPYLFLYSGQGIPADPLQCLAVNDDIPNALTSKDSEITGVSVPPGGAITVVGTTVTFSPKDTTGQGYYILVVTVNDP